MAPAKQLIKMHHACGIGLPKAHVALKLKPVVGGWHGDGQGDGEGRWNGSAWSWKARRTNHSKAIAEHQPKQPIQSEGGSNDADGCKPETHRDEPPLAKGHDAPAQQCCRHNRPKQMELQGTVKVTSESGGSGSR